MTLSANQYICPEGFGVEPFLDASVDAGYQSVGLTRAALAEMPLARLRQAVQTRGLQVTSLNSAGFFTWSDAEARKRQKDLNAELVDAAAELDAGSLCVISGGMAQQSDIATARALVLEGIAELDGLAARNGVWLGIEPIHPLGALTKGVVNSLAQAREIIDDLVASGLILDLSHSWWDPDLWRIIADPEARVRLVQICNVVLSDTALPRRSPALDQGALNAESLLTAIRGFGCTAPFEFEVFAVDHGLTDPSPLLKAAMDWYRNHACD